jgi:predicted N-acetyltransferase YhbS
MNEPDELPNIRIRHEHADDDAYVEELGRTAFGPGRFSRAAFRLREGVRHDPELSFVAEFKGNLVGSVRLTPVLIGGKRALVLGPLMIDPGLKNFGIGRELMNRALVIARHKGHRFVVLVGDYGYYKVFGFEKIPHGQITFPGPANPDRILGCQLQPGVLVDYHGQTTRDFGTR